MFFMQNYIEVPKWIKVLGVIQRFPQGISVSDINRQLIVKDFKSTYSYTIQVVRTLELIGFVKSEKTGRKVIIKINKQYENNIKILLDLNSEVCKYVESKRGTNSNCDNKKSRLIRTKRNK
jgi:hypothetical protein